MQLLGRCIKDLPREEIFVATKVGKYIPGEKEDFSADRVTRSVSESLARLQLDYIDLIHCHDIESAEDMKQVMGMLRSRSYTCLCNEQMFHSTCHPRVKEEPNLGCWSNESH